MPFPKAGYLYAVTGPSRYLAEALFSAASLRRHDPSAHVTLLTDAGNGDREEARSGFDHVVVRDMDASLDSAWERTLAFRRQHVFEASPYERTLFLDTDTYFLGNCRPLFALLDYYDLCLAQATGARRPVRVDGKVLPGHAAYNAGVVLSRRSAATRDLFRDWADEFRAGLARAAPGEIASDQTPLMTALARSACRVCVLHNNFNARFVIPERFKGRVAVLHGRHADPERIGRRINAHERLRLWLPDAEMCIDPRMGLRGWLRLLAYAGRSLVRALAARLRVRTPWRVRVHPEPAIGPFADRVPAPPMPRARLAGEAKGGRKE